ncbi:MAG: FtsX-like permease family protein, partial [Bacteroidales bacterium]
MINKKLWSEKKSSLSMGNSTIASISVGISLLVMILAITITDGFKWEIKERATALMGDIAVGAPGIEVTTEQYPIHPSPETIKQLQEIEGVKEVYRNLYRRAIIKEGDAIHGVLLKGVESNFDWSFFEGTVKEGKLPSLSDTLAAPHILLPLKIASKLGVGVGDPLLFYFIGNSIKAKKFIVSGLFNAHLEEAEESLALVSAKVVEEINGWESGAASSIEIHLSKRAGIEATLPQVERILENSSTVEHLTATPVERLFPHLFDWLNLLDFNVLIIIALMIAVAGFNMLSTLLILLLERISTIGLLKALGMRDREIHKIFLSRAASL